MSAPEMLPYIPSFLSFIPDKHTGKVHLAVLILIILGIVGKIYQKTAKKNKRVTSNNIDSSTRISNLEQEVSKMKTQIDLLIVLVKDI